LTRTFAALISLWTTPRRCKPSIALDRLIPRPKEMASLTGDLATDLGECRQDPPSPVLDDPKA
jgi:hypothetical protein